MRRFALLCTVLVVLAGCNAPGGVTDATLDGETTPATPTDEPSVTETAANTTAAGDATPTVSPTATPTPAVPDTTATPPRSPDALADTYEFEVTGGDPPFDARLVFARTALLLDRPGAEPPEAVEVNPPDEMRVITPFSQFNTVLGLERPDDAVLPAYVRSPRRVYLSESLFERPRFAEATFAQESAHVIQLRSGAPQEVSANLPDDLGPLERAYLTRSVVEGAAVYTEAVYQRQYLDVNRTRIDTLGERYLNASEFGRVSFGLYYFGARYVADRYDDPAQTWRLYANPPQTTEELIHGLEPGSEPLAPLSVEESADGWNERERFRSTVGELFLRATLATELNESVAARGADGWGNDERLVFTEDRADQTPAYVWVHRWDDPSNATEFETAMAEYLNRSANRTTFTVGGEQRAGWTDGGSGYRLVRVAPETTALLLGEPAFVRNATVSGSAGNVSVTTTGDTEASLDAAPVSDESDTRQDELRSYSSASGTPNTISVPTSATSAPTATARPSNACIGAVSRS